MLDTKLNQFGIAISKKYMETSYEVIKRARHIILRVISLIIALIIVGTLGLVIALSRGPVSLNFVTPILDSVLETILQLDTITFEDALLNFDKAHGGLGLRGHKITVMHQGARYTVEDYDVRLSTQAFLDNVQLVAETISVKQIVAVFPTRTITSNKVTNKDVPTEIIDPSEVLRKLRNQVTEIFQIDLLGYVQKIDLSAITLVFSEYGGDQVWLSTGSYVLFERHAEGVDAVFDVRLMSLTEKIHMHFSLSQPVSAPGKAELLVNNIRPSAIASLFPNFPILLLADAPLIGRVGFETNANGAFSTAEVEFKLASGDVIINNRTQPVKRTVAKASIDFISRTAVIDEVNFEIGPHSAEMSGSFLFDLDNRGAVSFIGGNFRAQKVKLKLSDANEFFSPDNLILDFELDLQEGRLDLPLIRFEMGGGYFSLGGEIAYQDAAIPITLQGQFENLPVEGLKRIWPSNVAPSVHRWVVKNVNGGEISSGKLQLTTSVQQLGQLYQRGSLPNEAFNLTAQLRDAELSYLDNMPPIQNIMAELVLGGNSFAANVSKAQTLVDLGGEALEIIELSNSYFKELDFDVRGNNVEILLNLEGTVNSILTLVLSEHLLGNQLVSFAPSLVEGKISAKADITLPLGLKLSRQEIGKRLTVNVEGVLNDYKLTQKIGNYHVAGNTLGFIVDKNHIEATGIVKLNNVAAQLEWYEAFGSERDTLSNLKLQARLNEYDFANLKLDDVAQRVRGVVDTELTLYGSIKRFNRLVAQVDVTQAAVMLSPIAYHKSKGMEGHIQLDLDFGQDLQKRQDLKEIEAIYEDSDTKLDVKAKMTNGEISHLDISPLKIKNHYDAAIDFINAENMRSLTVSGKLFDASNILSSKTFRMPEFDAAHPEFISESDPSQPAESDKLENSSSSRRNLSKLLGNSIDINFNIDRVLTNNGIWVDNFKGTVLRVKGFTESIDIGGVFNDETPLIVQLFRGKDNIRHFLVDVLQAGNLFKSMNLYDHLDGERVFLIGRLQGDKPFAGSGVFYMSDFNLKNVNTATKILSLASFTGVADTMQGEGVAFKQADANFRFNEELLEIESLRMKGPAIGITMNGIIDVRNDALYLDGTLVPAYSINSLLGRIPFIGWIFSNEKGGGLIGVSYRIEGGFDNPEVSVNPLSLFAPGFLQNIFRLRLFGPRMPSSVHW